MIKPWISYKNIIVVDYEFIQKDGNRPIPVCYCFLNLQTEEKVAHWVEADDTKLLYPTDDDSLFVAFFASAELGCHLVLGYDIPNHIIDLFVESRCLTNGYPIKRSLIDYCRFFEISHTELDYKNSMRERIQQGYPFTEKEKSDILEYCMKDVIMTAELFKKLQSQINKYALLRGRYQACVARMEHIGIPVDTELLEELKLCWDIIKEELIWKVNQHYNVFEGTIFKMHKFIQLIEKRGYCWEGTDSGLPRLDDKYFSNQAKTYPELKTLQELRHALNQLKLNDLYVGEDGHNRTLISPFRSITGRNQPSSSHFIFGASVWVRGLIKPQRGQALAYIDYSAEEIGIACALSGDEELKKDILTGDPYVAFGKTLGIIPENGTKKTHPEQRELCKIPLLGISYGMTPYGLALKAKIPLVYAYDVMRTMRKKYKKLYEWQDQFVGNAILSGSTHTLLKWDFNTSFVEKMNTLYNWPIQSSGSDLMRLAVTYCFDNGIKVCCPIHDAILIQANENEIKEKVKIAQNCMEYASKFLLGFEIKTEATIIRYPNRYHDEKGRGDLMWNSVMDILKNMNPSEKQARIYEKIIPQVSLKSWDKETPKKRRGKFIMKPVNSSERSMVERIKKQGKFSYIEIMHLIQAAKDSDFDIEHEVDWKNDSYQKILDKINHKVTMKQLTGEIY